MKLPNLASATTALRCFTERLGTSRLGIGKEPDLCENRIKNCNSFQVDIGTRTLSINMVLARIVVVNFCGGDRSALSGG